MSVVTAYYLDRGYVTDRAYLPQQDLSDGELEILVIEGRLEGLGSSELASHRELALAFPDNVGDRLNLRELEQLVDQLGRLQSRQVQLEQRRYLDTPLAGLIGLDSLLGRKLGSD